MVFHEITEPAIAEAFQHSREINMDLVDAQQARRVLDRLVGYSISPLLWRKVRSRLSAGRVQSVALRLIVEREREIDAFNPVEYWSIEAEFLPEGGKQSFIAKLAKIDDADPVLGNEADVKPLLLEHGEAAYQISQDQARRAAAQSIRSIHHQHAAAGSLTPTGLYCPADDGTGAAAL